jgi:hypothetical protein
LLSRKEEKEPKKRKVEGSRLKVYKIQTAKE